MSDNHEGPANHGQYTHHDARIKFEEYIDDCIKYRSDRLGKQYGKQVKDFVAFFSNKDCLV